MPCEEPELCYRRPQLSMVISKGDAAEGETFYLVNQNGLGPKKVAASSCAAKRPPCQTCAIVFRTLALAVARGHEDSRALTLELRVATSSALPQRWPTKIVVIGGGFMALEVASGASRAAKARDGDTSCVIPNVSESYTHFLRKPSSGGCF